MTSTRLIKVGTVEGRWWHQIDGGRIQCDLCPRLCKLRDGQRGFCFVREARDGRVVLTSYGRGTGYCIDPVEKKPLYHFLPGSSVLSFGTAGCNLGCLYCQNWAFSRAHEDHVLSAWATPKEVADAAVEAGCDSVAFTYNDPVIFAEYAIDTAIAARERGLRTIAVTNGYIMPEARRDFFSHIDAVNIDLKGFTEDFYHRVCYAHIEPVLDTLWWLRHETDIWLEITSLLIPGHNDSDANVAAMCRWIASELGKDVPLHFSRFFPAYRMIDARATSPSRMLRAKTQALEVGLRHVYTGNIADPEGQATYCPTEAAPVWWRVGNERN